jgi:hypothetical protein
MLKAGRYLAHLHHAKLRQQLLLLGVVLLVLQMNHCPMH